MSAVLIFRHANKSQSIRVCEDQPVRIGRGAPGLEIRVNHRSMSRVHAKIEKRDDGWYVSDLDSRNGTSVNGKKITEELLKAGDEIAFGKIHALFYPSTRAVPASVSPGKKEAKPNLAEGLKAPALQALSDEADEANEADEEEGEVTVAPARASQQRGDDDSAFVPKLALERDQPEEPEEDDEEKEVKKEAGKGAAEDGKREKMGKPMEATASREDPLGFKEAKESPKPKAASDPEKPKELEKQEQPEADLQEAHSLKAADLKSRQRKSVLTLLLVAAGGIAACIILGVLLVNVFRKKGPPDAAANTEATAAVHAGAATPGPAGASLAANPPASTAGNSLGSTSGTPAVKEVPEPPLPEIGETPPEEMSNEPPDEPATTLAAPPAIIPAAAKGPWGRAAAAFLDLTRQVETVDAQTAGEVQKAIASLPEDRTKSTSAAKAWLARPEFEWQFAGAKVAEILEDPSLSPPLLEAAQKIASGRSRSGGADPLAEAAIMAMAEALNDTAPVAMTGDLLKGVSDGGAAWAGEILKGIRRRSPDALTFEIQDYLFTRANEKELQNLIPFLATLDAWGADLSAQLVNQGLQSSKAEERMRFARTCMKVGWKNSTDQLMRLMKSDPDEKVKKAAQEALMAIGTIAADGDLEKLLSLFLKGSKEDRQKVYSTLEATDRIRQAERSLSKEAVALAGRFLQALRESGRERLLTDFFRPGGLYLEDGEEGAFKQQQDDEKYLADYTGIWPDHVWLLQNGMAVGLKPKNKEVVKMMEQAQPDKYGNPGWLTGPLFVLTPAEGEWKVEGLANMSYASNLTRMLRRQKEELKEEKSEKGKGK